MAPLAAHLFLKMTVSYDVRGIPHSLACISSAVFLCESFINDFGTPSSAWSLRTAYTTVRGVMSHTLIRWRIVAVRESRSLREWDQSETWHAELELNRVNEPSSLQSLQVAEQADCQVTAAEFETFTASELEISS